jgi:hypothetical protein
MYVSRYFSRVFSTLDLSTAVCALEFRIKNTIMQEVKKQTINAVFIEWQFVAFKLNY